MLENLQRIVMKNIKGKIYLFIATIASGSVILVDITIRIPFYSLVLSFLGLILFLFGFFLKKRKWKTCLIFFSAFPVCMTLGLLCQQIALFQAENLKEFLEEKATIDDIHKKYSEKCRGNSGNYCGFYTYRIILNAGEKMESSSLIVFQFFDRQSVIPLSRKS